ncbi:MAG: pentapeptide repeat-containing protein [Nostocales cyanobacterium LE14-WE4]|nr:pentapeptide repeat-containing protein [Anabaena sp. 49633_E8]MCE2699981.1 pentapeptide repeat-containing protein [Anabaena sp. 49633_E8]MDJ0500414.1 pentapeptide repeat-containing protein [Nostocales cyanobacterium LE14-WE4]
MSDAQLNPAFLNQADLSDANLRDADLSDANLKDANLSGTNLENADLSGANLENANLSGANLENADLSGANLENANLSGANLTGTIIDIKKEIDHKWAIVWKILNQEKFAQINQQEKNQISLSETRNHFSKYELECIDLSNSYLKNAKLANLNLTHTDFSNSNLHSADLRGANLTGANLTGVNLQEATLIKANLQGADLSNADLRYANIHGANLNNTKRDGAKFTTFDDISCSWNQLNDDQFEELCYDILREKHKLTDIQKIDKSRSRDGGRDIVFSKGVDINKKPIKWIAQCKLKSDKRSLGKSQVPDISDMLKAQAAKGFCIMTSGIIGATLHDSLDALRDKEGWEVERWSYLEIERFLAEHPEIKSRHFKD